MSSLGDMNHDMFHARNYNRGPLKGAVLAPAVMAEVFPRQTHEFPCFPHVTPFIGVKVPSVETPPALR